MTVCVYREEKLKDLIKLLEKEKTKIEEIPDIELDMF